MRQGRAPSSQLGRSGERIAARHLRLRGYRVIGKNVRVGGGEADLVCLSPDRRVLVVVEVKARRVSVGERRPESQVGADKQARLRRIASSLHDGPRFRSLGVRIDVVAVELGRWPWSHRVRHLRRAVSWS